MFPNWKKTFCNAALILGSVLGTLFLSNLGSPTVRSVVNWLNPPAEVLTARGALIADSVEIGEGWTWDGIYLVHEATGLTLSKNVKNEKDTGMVAIGSKVPNTVPPKYSESDLRLLRPFFDKRVAKIEDEVETIRLDGLKPPKPQKTTGEKVRDAAEKAAEKLKDTGKAAVQKLNSFRQPAQAATPEAAEQLTPPSQDK